MSGKSGSSEDGGKWLCPWCGAVADLPTPFPVNCESRTCSCGAVALGAPPWAFGAALGDAAGVFAVKTRLGSFDSNALLLEDIRRSGVEFREGVLAEGWSGERRGVEYRYLWFRQQAPPDA
jgi:hypothetical protein